MVASLRGALIWSCLAGAGITCVFDMTNAVDVRHGEGAFVRQCALCHTEPQRQRNPRGIQNTGSVARRHQDKRLRQLPSDRQLCDAQDSGSLRTGLVGRGLAERLQARVGGTAMVRTMGRLLTPDGGHLAALADWTDRIAKGELPAASPQRPNGVERNLVITVRDWLDPKHYLHDLTVTDRRQPTVNGNGLIYGATELSTDDMPVLDPVRNAKSVIRMPVRDGEGTPSSALANPVLAPSAYFGTEQVWDSRANAHTPVMDQDGRVYFTAQSRPPNAQPAYCGKTRRCVRRSSIR
jgi:hypothetical protein